ncbi:hypothetical protein Micbo1qcDRAFT_36262 [Microdochium bolleyi]|uniref:Uncharacterized protein n=1 Tax=Microdochium bolleyi TaxID=196109 RepID=A0A136IN64_9PEZI|nr:hypothetical protein Micbo1qcDRAFT_36262 [Microdochium bolleyi]
MRDPDPPNPAVECNINSTQDVPDEYPLEGFTDKDFVFIADLADMTRAASPDSTVTLLPSKTDLHQAWTLIADHPSADIIPQSVITTPYRQSPGAPSLPPDIGDKDQFEEDIDWDTACSLTTSATPPDTKATTGSAQSIGTSPETEHKDEFALSPFIRPPFPDIASSKVQVPGVSGQTVLRTCFRVGEMISQTAKCHTQQQDVVFEIYARVKQSERKTTTKIQHFSLTDLFKTQPPYPRASLAGWRAASDLDQQAADFLGSSGVLKLYWCLCRPVRDPRSTVGWTYTILSIKTVTWAHIQQAKDVLFHAHGMSNTAGSDEAFKHK